MNEMLAARCFILGFNLSELRTWHDMSRVKNGDLRRMLEYEEAEQDANAHFVIGRKKAIMHEFYTPCVATGNVHS